MKATQKDKLPMINLQEFYYVEAKTGTVYKIYQNPDNRVYTSTKLFSCGHVGATKLDLEYLLINVSKAVEFYHNPGSMEDAPFFANYDLALAGLRKVVMFQRDQEIEAIKVKYNKLMNFGEES